MPVLSVNNKRKFLDYAIVLWCGVMLHFIMKWDLMRAVGAVYFVYIVIDILMLVLAKVTAIIMFQEFFPKNIKELKHSPRSFQYIVDDGKNEHYTVEYDKPLEKVNIRCYKFMGRSWFEVTRRRAKNS